MKDLIIAGAGGAGRETLWYIKEINAISPTWNIKGFIDDTKDTLNGAAGEYDIIGTINDWQPSENEVFAAAIYDSIGRLSVVEKLKSKGAEFATIIHPTMHISEFAEIGEGCILGPRGALSTNTKIGEFCYMQGSVVGHDVTIGKFCDMAYNAFMGGFSSMGDYSYMGVHSVLLPHKKIGNNSYVGAGSVVIKNVRDNTRVFGNPAKKMDF